MRTDILLERMRVLEATRPMDTSDGSVSWFRMRHKEGILLDVHGEIIRHQRAGGDPHRITYDARDLAEALAGGGLMHSHTVDQGASFSFADLALALCRVVGGPGLVMVVTTNHPVEGISQDVRYTLDTRETQVRAKLSIRRAGLEALWNNHDGAVMAEMAAGPDTLLEEMFAEHIHRVVGRVCRDVGVAYRREIVR